MSLKSSLWKNNISARLNKSAVRAQVSYRAMLNRFSIGKARGYSSFYVGHGETGFPLVQAQGANFAPVAEGRGKMFARAAVTFLLRKVTH